MAKKPVRPQPPPTPAAAGGRSKIPLAVGAIVVVVVLGVAVAMMRGGSTADTATANGAAATPASDATSNEPPHAAKFGPHTQANYPPLPDTGYPPPRPAEVVDAVYKFAAEHPEVLGYIPCYCGCERQGHRGNDDCFVARRNANGDVEAWDTHGMTWAICIDIARDAMQMHASGASVRDIRAATEKKWGSQYPTSMPTPKPPADARD